MYQCHYPLLPLSYWSHPCGLHLHQLLQDAAEAVVAAEMKFRRLYIFRMLFIQRQVELRHSHPGP